MNNEKKNDVGIILLVIVLLIVVVVMSIYIVVNKVGSNNDIKNGDVNTPSTSDEQQIKQENLEFFDKYLYSFLPGPSANYFKKTISSFNDQNISNFLFWYVYNNRTSIGVCDEEKQICTVSKEKLDEIVYKYFGKKDYTISQLSGSSGLGIKKLSDEEYQIYWGNFGVMAPQCNNSSIVYNGNNVTVSYDLTNDLDQYNVNKARLEFKLTYSEGRYIVNSIYYTIIETK